MFRVGIRVSVWICPSFRTLIVPGKYFFSIDWQSRGNGRPSTSRHSNFYAISAYYIRCFWTCAAAETKDNPARTLARSQQRLENLENLTIPVISI